MITFLCRVNIQTYFEKKINEMLKKVQFENNNNNKNNNKKRSKNNKSPNVVWET